MHEARKVAKVMAQNILVQKKLFLKLLLLLWAKFKIDNTGKLTYYKLDSDGKVMMDKITNNPIIYNINKE